MTGCVFSTGYWFSHEVDGGKGLTRAFLFTWTAFAQAFLLPHSCCPEELISAEHRGVTGNICKTLSPTQVTPGQDIARRCGTVTVMKWKNKRDMFQHCPLIIRDASKNAKKESGLAISSRSKAVLEYNRFVCGVDSVDQLLSYYSSLFITFLAVFEASRMMGGQCQRGSHY